MISPRTSADRVRCGADKHSSLTRTQIRVHRHTTHTHTHTSRESHTNTPIEVARTPTRTLAQQHHTPENHTHRHMNAYTEINKHDHKYIAHAHTHTSLCVHNVRRGGQTAITLSHRAIPRDIHCAIVACPLSVRTRARPFGVARTRGSSGTQHTQTHRKHGGRVAITTTHRATRTLSSCTRTRISMTATRGGVEGRRAGDARGGRR